MSWFELLAPDPGASGMQQRVYGVVTGIVKDIHDPMDEGRVKVNFPWLAEDAEGVKIEQGGGSEVAAHSFWARIARPLAGDKRGTWTIPQLNDEVAVAFEHGDMDRPIVLGVLWNQDDKLPDADELKGDKKYDVTAFYSITGHKIVVNDSKDKPGIEIVDSSGKNSIAIDTKNNAMTIKVEGELKIEVGGNITITSKGSIKIEATQNIQAEAKQNVELKATADAKMEGSAGATLKSDAKASVEGSAQAELKGAMVSVNGSGITEVKGGLVKIN